MASKSIENILKEDELRLLIPAVEDMRKNGFGEVTLYFRNGYVYRVKHFIDSYNTERPNNKEQKE